MACVARYVIVLDRMDDDDNVSITGEDYHGPPRTDEEGKEQVARELQEAMNEMGEPAGFFRVVARTEVEYDGVLAHVAPEQDAHRAAAIALDMTRNY